MRKKVLHFHLTYSSLLPRISPLVEEARRTRKRSRIIVSVDGQTQELQFDLTLLFWALEEYPRLLDTIFSLEPTMTTTPPEEETPAPIDKSHEKAKKAWLYHHMVHYPVPFLVTLPIIFAVLIGVGWVSYTTPADTRSLFTISCLSDLLFLYIVLSNSSITLTLSIDT